jgi:outer membrane receptor protein involved in Fe transport
LVDDQSLTTVRARAKAWAVFGDIDYRLTETLSLQAGVRRYESDNTQLVRFETTSLIFGTVAGVERPSSGKASATSPKLGLRWMPSKTLMVYTRVADGFRDGGSNYQAPGYPEIVSAYGPEKIRSYELGVKSQPLSWLTVNGSIYRNNWTDLQLSFLTSDALFNFIQNAGKAVATGGEIELTARPMAGLRVGLNLAFVDAKIDKDVFNALGLPVATKGNRIPFSPRFQASVAAAYQFALPGNLNGIVSGNLSHRDATYSTPDNDPSQRNGSADLLNLRFGVNAERWSAALFVNNAGNRRASTTRALFPGATVTQATFLPPRTVGVELSAEF